MGVALHLQEAYGNGVATKLIRDSLGRSELRIGPADSPLEHEADRVTREVMQRSPSVETDNDLKPEHRDAHGDTGPAAESVGQTGQPLPPATRALFESRFGQHFGDVRVHTDDRSAQAAQALGARAFTVGRHITFGDGQFAPQTHGGQRLLAHELTHVVQQGAAGPFQAGSGVRVQQSGPQQIQRSLWDDVVSGLKTAGSAVAGAIGTAAGFVVERAKDVGRFFGAAAEWIGERLSDAARWAVNLIRDLPQRLQRLASTVVDGLASVVTFIPEAIRALASGGIGGFAGWLWDKAKAGGAWVLRLVSRVFDVLGGPELAEFIWHMVTKARPPSGAEIAAASSVLGPDAIRWGDVRISEGGLLDLIFALNNGRAFVAFHTVNLPPGETMDVVVHEMTHVYQYERAGGIYLGQAIHAQAVLGGRAYDYGGPAGLVADQAAGKHFRDFNREQQAQIAQDYYRYIILGQRALTPQERQAYDFFVNELRAGDL